MYKRYVGNTGRFVMVQDAEDDSRVRTAARPRASDVPPPQPERASEPPSSGGGFSLPFNLPFKLPFGLESSDLTLLLIFLFLFLQSGDDEFLILLAALVFA